MVSAWRLISTRIFCCGVAGRWVVVALVSRRIGGNALIRHRVVALYVVKRSVLVDIIGLCWRVVMGKSVVVSVGWRLIDLMELARWVGVSVRDGSLERGVLGH